MGKLLLVLLLVDLLFMGPIWLWSYDFVYINEETFDTRLIFHLIASIVLLFVAYLERTSVSLIGRTKFWVITAVLTLIAGFVPHWWILRSHGLPFAYEFGDVLRLLWRTFLLFFAPVTGLHTLWLALKFELDKLRS